MIGKISIKFLIAGLAFGGLVFFVAATSVEPAYAQSFSDVQGWAWADVPDDPDTSVGWISFKGTASDGTGYDVNINNVDGLMSGYAWSEHFGWLSFNTSELGGCPSGTCEARFSIAAKKITGWARFLANDGDFDGWVSLSGTADDGAVYGPTFDTSSKEFSGWAWGGDVVGWISFSCENENVCSTSDYKVTTNFVLSLFVSLEAKQTGITWFTSLTGIEPFNGIDLRGSVLGNATGSINYTFYCNRSDSGTNITSGWDAKFDGETNAIKIVNNLCNYPTAGSYTAKVIVERDSLAVEDRVPITVDPPLNSPPSAINLSVTPSPVCINPLQPTLSWTFSDPDSGDSQSAYKIQGDNNSDYSSPEVDTGKTTSSSNSYTVPAGRLSFNTTYNWRVRVWDQSNSQSSWADGTNFTTLVHAAPDPNFSWLPTEPLVDETTLFSDQSTFYGGATAQSYDWTFQDAIPATSVQLNPAVKFASTGSKTITLVITDSDDLSCSIDKNLNISLPAPQFREVNP